MSIMFLSVENLTILMKNNINYRNKRIMFFKLKLTTKMIL